MRNLSEMPKWPILLLAAAAASCTAPAPTNAVVEDNGAAVAANTMIVDHDVASVANETGPATAPSPKAAPAAPETYAAVGQEPGWALKIAGGRIDYEGNYGEKKISVERPEPKPAANGRRYVTPRLTVAIAYARCNDAMSGFGFEHQVTVIADGETYKGCGGARKTEWDL
jgi:uncharacterized membrane protein